jgi:hypothetical protein
MVGVGPQACKVTTPSVSVSTAVDRQAGFRGVCVVLDELANSMGVVWLERRPCTL